jgi:predicted transcriptional regulator
VESFSKLDVIAIILKTAHKKCDYEEIYSRLQANLTTSQMMKFILELKKYNLLKSKGNESSYVITPEGRQYLQIHKELTSQVLPEVKRNSLIFNCCNSFSKLTHFFKKKNSILKNI